MFIDNLYFQKPHLIFILFEFLIITTYLTLEPFLTKALIHIVPSSKIAYLWNIPETFLNNLCLSKAWPVGKRKGQNKTYINSKNDNQNDFFSTPGI